LRSTADLDQSLANALMAQFDQSGRRDVLDAAISLYRDALIKLQSSPNLDRCKCLNNLANALVKQFQSG
jgi:hypothetical protein